MFWTEMNRDNSVCAGVAMIVDCLPLTEQKRQFKAIQNLIETLKNFVVDS